MSTKKTGNFYAFEALRNRVTVNYILGSLEEYVLSYADTNDSLIYTMTLNPGHEAPRDWHKALFMLDDGASLKPYYVAGYQQDKLTVYLHPVIAGSTRYAGPAPRAYFIQIKK